MSKAANLTRLQNAGFQVPSFVVVPKSIFASFLGTLATAPNGKSIAEASLPDALAQEILALAHQLPKVPVAVRSSMSGEDSAKHSFAGQLDSFLNVEGDKEILRQVKACWASAFGERVNAYRKGHNLSSNAPEMEVIIQTMLTPNVSGVIFTTDPVARDPRWLLISAVEGLGEALVQGAVAGETSRVKRESGEIEGEGIILAPTQITRLTEVALKIEALFGSPQDIEFAIESDEIYILQSRPITTKIFTEHILWDNSNITESYSGVTTPLTYSVIRGAYAQVYRQFLALMGVQRVDEFVLKHLLGLYNGQVYYQLYNWYAALAHLPAFEQNRRFMEQMMGVKQTAGQGTHKRSGGTHALILWLIRMIGLHGTSEQRVLDFLKQFNRVLTEYQARDFSTFSPHQLRAAYFDLQARVLGKWQAPIVTDFFGMIFYGVLRRLSERWLDSRTAIYNNLLVGDGAIESIEPARRIAALGTMVRESQHLHQAFTDDPKKTLEIIRTDPQFASFHALFQGYLLRYGDRCMNELKLEEPNLRDNPGVLIRLISSAAENPVEHMAGSNVRSEAEAFVSLIPLHKRIFFRWVLSHARRHIRNRENMRFARTRLFGLLRGIFNSLGNQWAEAGIIKNTRDIYYLTVEEIWDFVDGTAVTKNLAGLISLRQEEYTGYRSVKIPDRFETFGVPYLDSPRDLLSQPASEDGLLKGIGCCSGLVRGRTKLVVNLDDIGGLNGHILIAERTDPGWVFLFPSASGILIERGSPLSHSVIVAREMGKPIIVNIPNLTGRIQSGDEVEMDGGLGTVKVLNL